MKHRRSHASFIENLRRKVRSLKKLKPNDVYVFTVNANYGHYQITIGPMNSHHERNLEIEGEIHHLFVSPHLITPNPTKEQVGSNLKDMVIMRDLEIHLVDPAGDGKHLASRGSDAHPRECINLAGKNGELLMRHVESSGRLPKAAYRIIQRDILHSLKQEETTSD